MHTALQTNDNKLIPSKKKVKNPKNRIASLAIQRKNITLLNVKQELLFYFKQL